MRIIALGLLFALYSHTSLSQRYILESRFEDSPVPPPPDYSIESCWASLPSKKDPADSIPDNSFTNNQTVAVADVFFIHPTSYTFKPKTLFKWNGDVSDERINHKTDYTSILYQASVFNGSCRIYAPRYRQAHISAFYTKHHEDKQMALNIAYEDVKRAFQYYLEHYNHQRPIIIAAHSQGTLHAVRILIDFFKAGNLKEQLVAAYLVGMPVNPDSLDFLLPCNSSDQTGCYCTWNTFARDYYPKYYNNGLINAICTNPLSWNCSDEYSSSELNKGGVLKNFKKVRPNVCDAQVHEGMLWIRKPQFPFAFLLPIKIYHIGDYNLFYMNIRENADERINALIKKGATIKSHKD